MAENKKGYIYTRVSTEMQVEGFSLSAQEERIRARAKSENIKIVGVYSDAGKSGKSIEGREEFQRMLDDVRSGRDGVSYILVFKLSRFARNVTDALNVLNDLKDHNVNLISVEEGIDTSKPTGKLLLTIIGAIAEMERENIAVQTMAGRIEKARQGLWNGGAPPLGYMLDENKNLVIKDDEAVIVKKIYELYLSDDTTGAVTIAKKLDKLGYKRPVSGESRLARITAPMVRRILSNPTYSGKIRYGYHTTEYDPESKHTRRIASDDYLIADGKHQAIIDEKTWAMAQDKLAARDKRPEPVHEDEYLPLLSRIVRCPVCGGSLNVLISRKRNRSNGKMYTAWKSYACFKDRNVKGDYCGWTKQIKCEVLDAAVEEVVLKIWDSATLDRQVYDKIAAGSDTKKIQEDLDRINDQIRKKQAVKTKMSAQMDALDPDDDLYDAKYDELVARQEAVFREIKVLEGGRAEVEAQKRQAESAQTTYGQVKKVLEELSVKLKRTKPENKRDLYHAVLSRIEIYPEKTVDGKIVKSIEFAFPVNGSTVDGIVIKDFEITAAESKATYKQISDYVRETMGIRVTGLYIAQTKRKYGLPIGEKKPEGQGHKVTCPPDKEKAILDAFRHFKMLPEEVD